MTRNDPPGRPTAAQAFDAFGKVVERQSIYVTDIMRRLFTKTLLYPFSESQELAKDLQKYR